MGVVVLNDAEIMQWAMSCRVLGLDVEYAVLGAIAARLAQSDASRVTAVVKATDHNFLCRSFYELAGFQKAGDHWETELAVLADRTVDHVRTVRWLEDH